MGKKYYCEYCDITLSHCSPKARYEHNTGRRHIINKINYYEKIILSKLSFQAPEGHQMLMKDQPVKKIKESE